MKLRHFSKKGNKHFIFIGRMFSHKNPESSIEVVLEWNRMRKKSIPIVLVGVGEQYEKLSEKYKDNKLVDFRGEVTDQQKIELLSYAIINVFLSKREGMPKSAVECLASEVPTLTTDYVDNGTKDFVREYNIGVVCEPKQSKLVKSLDYLYENIQEYANRCREHSQGFDVSYGVNYLIENCKSEE